MDALHDLPVIKNQTAFNLARWAELCADPLWVNVEGKIETDRYGRIIRNPPADPAHGGRQADLFEIGSGPSGAPVHALS